MWSWLNVDASPIIVQEPGVIQSTGGGRKVWWPIPTQKRTYPPETTLRRGADGAVLVKTGKNDEKGPKSIEEASS